MPIFRILSNGVFLAMSLTVPIRERLRFGTRPDFVIVRVSKFLFQAVEKRGDRHPLYRIGLAPRSSGSFAPCDAGSLKQGPEIVVLRFQTTTDNERKHGLPPPYGVCPLSSLWNCPRPSRRVSTLRPASQPSIFRHALSSTE